MSGRFLGLVAAAATVALLASVSLRAQGPAPAGADDWPMYNRDLAGTRYSPLTQINTTNVSRLVRAWSYNLSAPDLGERGLVLGSEFTPIVVRGMLYLAAANRVLALEPETGKEIWRYVPPSGTPSKRGISYWPGDEQNPPRVIFTTSSHTMIALNAKTGKIDPGFGKEGVVDIEVPYNSAPVVYKNLLILGANVQEKPAQGPPGDTRAYDARTGAKIWEFHSVPRPGETGNGTWDSQSWKNRSGANDWGFSMTIDTERDVLYTVFGSPSSDFYGADRKGNNLFGNSLVALEATTGRLEWYFQAVHHDLWDYDLPSPPGLLDVTIRGRKAPLLALAGKTGYMYILDRTTGKPIFGIEEKPVPASNVPGEQSSPTEPIPVKPPALARTSYKPQDIVTAADTNSEHANFCRTLVDRSGGFYNEGPFTPYIYRAPGAKPHTTILYPGSIGGMNWGGTASDPNLGYVFVNSVDEGSIGWIEDKPAGSQVLKDRNSIVGPTSRFQWAEGEPRVGNIRGAGEHAWPCQKPPWGQMTAVNAATGDVAWKVPLGITDELPGGKKNTGRLNLGGPIATAGGIVFIGATNDRRFRAFDSKTGKELWSTKLDASAHAVPITYRGKNGKQYVAIVAGGNGTLDDRTPGAEALVVFTLP